MRIFGAIFLFLNCLFIPAVCFSAQDEGVMLGDANQAPGYTSQLVCANQIYDQFSVKDVNSYGVLMDVGMGMYANQSRALVIRHDGKTRGFNLREMFEGDATDLFLDDEGYLFLENQLKYGCHYEVVCISPEDKVLWKKEFVYSRDCKGGDTWGIEVGLQQYDGEIWLSYFERKPTGEFAMKVKKDSGKMFRLKDKNKNIWEIDRPRYTKELREGMYYYSVPHRMKGDGVIEYKNDKNKTIGRVRLKEGNNPKVLGKPTRMVELYKDRCGNLYGLYYYDSPLGDVYSGMRYLVTYSKDGTPKGKYEFKTGEDIRLFQTGRMGQPFNEKGEIFYTREREPHRHDLLKLTLK